MLSPNTEGLSWDTTSSEADLPAHTLDAPPDVLRTRGIVEAIRGDTDDTNEINRECISDLYAVLEAHNLHLSENFGDYFDSLTAGNASNILVRKENVAKFLEHITSDQPMGVGMSLNDEQLGGHANAAMLGSRAEGLRLAFEEGFDDSVKGRMSIVVCFDPSNLEVHGITNDSITAQNKPDTVALMRSIRGTILQEDMLFVAIRWPRKLFPQELMGEDEKEETGQFIIRYFIPTIPRRVMQ